MWSSNSKYVYVKHLYFNSSLPSHVYTCTYGSYVPIKVKVSCKFKNKCLHKNFTREFLIHYIELRHQLMNEYCSSLFTLKVMRYTGIRDANVASDSDLDSVEWRTFGRARTRTSRFRWTRKSGLPKIFRETFENFKAHFFDKTLFSLGNKLVEWHKKSIKLAKTHDSCQFSQKYVQFRLL